MPAGAESCAPGWTAVGTECELIVSASGEVTIPAGVAKVDVTVVGGGGGGGGGTVLSTDGLCRFDFPFDCKSSNFSYAGGGGSGGQTVCTGLELSGAVSVVIGAGGAGAVSATAPAVTPPGGDGESTTVADCTAAGGKGGGSSRSITGSINEDPSTRQNGAGGESGNGVAGFAAPAYPQEFGGGGASNDPTGPTGRNGGLPTKPTGGCFTGTKASWAAGGGGASPAGAGTGGQSYVYDPALGTYSIYTSGSAGADLYRPLSKLATAGPPNSGNGGGGGQQLAPYRYSDGTVFPAEAFDGADGGSGVVVLRYSIAGEPTIQGGNGLVNGGQLDVTIFGTGFTCEPVVTVGGNPCTPVVVVSATQITCTTSLGTGRADVVVTTPTGSATKAGAVCYGQPRSPECAVDNGGGGDTGDGGGDGTASDDGADTDAEDASLASSGARAALPATGADMLLALAGTASVVAGSAAMALGARRRRTT
jgi:hypothetical protein